MADLLVRDLGKVKSALAKALRTDASTAASVVDRYIELRPGVQEKLGSETNHLLTGRRGTGKSTLLYVLKDRLTRDGVSVATVDMESFNGREYPDVLIEILIDLLSEIRPKLGRPKLRQKVILNVQFRRLKKDLEELLSAPQKFAHQLNRTEADRANAEAAVALSAQFKGQGLTAGFGGRRSNEISKVSTATYEELKIERLQTLVPRISKLLTAMVRTSTGKYALIFLDDFYFVRLEEQPAVLGYLHQVCKGTGVFLKVGGVGSRLRPFTDGNPPVGMQPGHDVSRLLLDVTLADFGTAQRFLEQMLEGVLQEWEITTSHLFAQEARNRMVLACGGAVARDYLTLVDAALDEAVERLSKAGTFHKDGSVRVITADVQAAMKKQTNTKEQESFEVDAVSDADKLREMWRDVCAFTAVTENVFVLIPQADLESEEWGKNIQQLENLRLLHRIKDTTANSQRWKGVKMMVFMVDLGQAANLRLRVNIPDFWKSTSEFEKLRRAEWVYTPDWQSRVSRTSKKGTKSKAKATTE